MYSIKNVIRTITSDNKPPTIELGETIQELILSLETIQAVRSRFQATRCPKDFEDLLAAYCLIGGQTAKFIDLLNELEQTIADEVEAA